MKLPIRTLIVDDEPPARERLTALLGVHSQIEIVGEAGDVESAFVACKHLHPDLIFLDIQLPRASGFELIPRLSPSPAIIFLTAFDHYALRAFEVNALDYLLKPIRPDRLREALTRVKLPERKEPNPSIPGLETIALNESGIMRRVFVLSISHVQAADNYTKVHFLDGSSTFVRKPLSEWETLLPSQMFLRVGRSLLVQLACVRTIQMKSRSRTLLSLAGTPAPLELGRTAGLMLRRALKETCG